MIITCGQCSTHFQIKDTALGENGRTVRCAKCGHNWFQRPRPSAAFEPTPSSPESTSMAITNPVPDEAPRLSEKAKEFEETLSTPPTKPRPKAVALTPTIDEPTNSGLTLWAMLLPIPIITTLLLTVFAIENQAIRQKLPFTERVYKRLALYPYRELRLDKVTIEPLQDNKEANLSISAFLTNTGSKKLPLPQLWLSLLDNEHHTLVSKSIPISDTPGEFIDAKGVYRIERQINYQDDKAAFLKLDIGNWVDFFLR